MGMKYKSEVLANAGNYAKAMVNIISAPLLSSSTWSQLA